jgi:uncharacterized membrane protein
LESNRQARRAAAWRAYVSEWTAWNHVRAAAALSAAVVFTLALLNARLRSDGGR